MAKDYGRTVILGMMETLHHFETIVAAIYKTDLTVWLHLDVVMIIA